MGRAGARDGAHRREAGKKAKNGRDHDEAQVVLFGDAADDPKHAVIMPPCRKRLLNWNPVPFTN
jgi:hypothetical protein